MESSRNSPPSEVIETALSACFESRVLPGQKVIVGLSGGLDSTVLLHAVHRFVLSQGQLVAAIHINHGLSPNADSWSDHCVNSCTGLGIPYEIRRVSVPLDSGKGLEDAARRVRHREFAALSGDWVLLAHHADDQAETLLLNLLRGTGLRGAAAIPEGRGKVLRPLLSVPRSVLVSYAQENRLEWIEDESNRDQRYTRNFVRHALLPVVAERFPRAVSQLAAATRRFSEAQGLLDDLARVDLGGHPTSFPVALSSFKDLSGARAINLLRSLLTWHQVQAPDERRMTEFVRQIQTAAADRHPSLQLSGYELWSSGGMVHFKKLDLPTHKELIGT